LGFAPLLFGSPFISAPANVVAAFVELAADF